jgi:archaellum component FlaC
MNPALLNWGPVAVIVGGYLLGIYFQNRSIAHVEKRIDDTNNRISHLEGEFNNRFSDLRDFIHSETRRLEDRIDRLDRPVLRS